MYSFITASTASPECTRRPPLPHRQEEFWLLGLRTSWELVLLRVVPSLLWLWDTLLDTMAMAVPHGCPSPVGTLPAEVLACCPIAMGLAWSLPVPVLSHPSFPLLPWWPCQVWWALAAWPCPVEWWLPAPWPCPGHPEQRALPEGHRVAGVGGGHRRSPHPTLLLCQNILEQVAQGSVQLGLEDFNTSKVQMPQTLFGCRCRATVVVYT